MKKLITILLILTMTGSLFGCTDNGGNVNKTQDERFKLLDFVEVESGTDSIINIYKNYKDGATLNLQKNSAKLNGPVYMNDINIVSTGVLKLPLIEETSAKLPEAYEMFFKNDAESYEEITANWFKRKVPDSLIFPNLAAEKIKRFTFGAGIVFYDNMFNEPYAFPMDSNLKKIITIRPSEMPTEYEKNYVVYGNNQQSAKDAVMLTQDYYKKQQIFLSEVSPEEYEVDYVIVYQDTDTGEHYFYVRLKSLYQGISFEPTMAENFSVVGNTSDIFKDHVIISNYSDAMICGEDVVVSGMRTGFKTAEEYKSYDKIITPETAFNLLAEKLADNAEFKFDRTELSYVVLSEKPEKDDVNKRYENDLLYFPCWKFVSPMPHKEQQVNIYLINAISGEIYLSTTNDFAH